MLNFINRESELELVCNRAASLLVTFYGEAGIGKTSLLNAAEIQLSSQAPPPLVARVDFENLHGYQSRDLSLRVLQSLVASNPRLAVLQQEGGSVTADQLVRHLHACDPVPVLMFDTTEDLQTDAFFWGWLEEGLVRPLLLGGHVRLIFAGRVPAPWRDYDVRRQNQQYRLTPLSTQDGLEKQGAARRLLREVLRQSAQSLTETEIQTLSELILEFSCGHPGLSKLLTQWAIAPGAGRWPAADSDQLRRQMAEGPVKQFIDDFLFEKVASDWRLVLKWASILNWFDAAVLHQYLEALTATGVLPRHAFFDDWDSFFLQSIDRLRFQDAAVMWGKDGYQLYGVTREIVRQCLKVTDPAGFRQANRCAGNVIHALACEFAPDEDGFARYTQETETYFQQAREEVLI